MSSATLDSLLVTLRDSLETARTSFRDKSEVQAPENGISLLDVKNELFLSYLQNLVFLVLLKVRRSSDSASGATEDPTANEDTQEKVIKTLVELRIYLERGIKPLESRLRYQIDKVVRAAEESSRTAKTNGTKAEKPNKKAIKDGPSSEESSDYDAEELDPLAYRPNPSAFKRTENAAIKSSQADEAPSGLYRPPRIAATMMPEDRPSRAERASRPQKSATLEEFVASELSTAPVAEPSIGTTIRQGGRRSVTDRERREARERREYEETHFVRLPKESKAERKRKGGGARNAGWGGEEWHDLGKGADRVVGALGKRRNGDGGGRVRQALDRIRSSDASLGRASGRGGARMSEKFERSKRRRLQ